MTLEVIKLGQENSESKIIEAIKPTVNHARPSRPSHNHVLNFTCSSKSFFCEKLSRQSEQTKFFSIEQIERRDKGRRVAVRHEQRKYQEHANKQTNKHTHTNTPSKP